jgi:hypothetical protein
MLTAELSVFQEQIRDLFDVESTHWEAAPVTFAFVIPSTWEILIFRTGDFDNLFLGRTTGKSRSHTVTHLSNGTFHHTE